MVGAFEQDAEKPIGVLGSLVLPSWHLLSNHELYYLVVCHCCYG
jgi:hypothetical protein